LHSVALSARLSLGTNEFGASKGFTLFDLPLLEVVGNGATRCLKGGNVVPPAAAAFRFVCPPTAPPVVPVTPPPVTPVTPVVSPPPRPVSPIVPGPITKGSAAAMSTSVLTLIVAVALAVAHI
jgi:hypothetical protein